MSVSTDDPPAEEEQQEVMEEVDRTRSLSGVAAVFVAIVGITFSAFQLWIAARSFQFWITIPGIGRIEIASLQLLQANAIHVAFALLLAFFIFPPTRGDGPIARRLSRVPSLVEKQFGATSAVTAGMARIQTAVRWAAVDPDGRRVTPVDIILAGLTLLSPLYMLTEFDEIRRMRVRNLSSGRSIEEVYPVVEPVVSAISSVGVPIDEISYALILGTIGVILVLEATRRALGLLLMGLIGLFLVYARFGYLIPIDSVLGPLSIPQTPWESLIRDLWFNTEAGIYGVPVTVSLRFIYIFILFGAFLEMSGAGRWFIDFAYSLTGARRGGPAKSSVVASGFMGMLSGSSVANTVTTGAFTIPLMKRSGYSPSFAGAVESSASSGGQVLPPVMGAAAFLIVEFTGIPYAEVIIAAALPALAFFFGMWVMVHFEAVDNEIGGLDRSKLNDPRQLLAQGWFYLVPIVLLVYLLVSVRLSVARSAWYTIIALVALVLLIAAYNEQTRRALLGGIGGLLGVQSIAYWLTGNGIGALLTGVLGGGLETTGMPLGAALRQGLADAGGVIMLVSLLILVTQRVTTAPYLNLDPAVNMAAETSAQKLGRPELAERQSYRMGAFLLKSMDAGAKTATTVVIAVAAAGVIPGVISVTGLGPNLTALILTVSGESFIGLLVLTGITAIIFGMGMPTTVMYIILVAMLGPAIEEFGVAIIAAHLYILYFGLMADVTPPVAVAAFAAAGVAKADEFKTAVTAFLLSLNKIMVPLAFVFSPGILLLRQTEEGPSVIGLSDIADLGFFLPEVLVPILGMFLGVYALGVTIIGYQYTGVSRFGRAGYAGASVLLMVPEVILLPASPVLGAAGPASGVVLRALGFVVLVVLTVRNRRRGRKKRDVRSPSPQPGQS